METNMPTRTERFDTRLSAEQKELFIKAAAIQGMTLTNFIINSAQEAAKKVLHEEEILSLTLRDRFAFVEALQDDTHPNETLKRAARNYKEKQGIS